MKSRPYQWIGRWGCFWAVLTLNTLVVHSKNLNHTPSDLSVKKRFRSFNALSDSEVTSYLLRCMKIIQQYYVDHIDQNTLVQWAIQGMCSGADPHSIFFSPKEYARLQEQYKGSFGGIGVVMNMDRLGQMKVVSCLDDTPAAKAGLLPGDIIVAIDGVDIRSSDGFSMISERMRGKPGTSVTLSIKRAGQSDRLIFQIKRTTIVSALSVKYQIKDDMAIIRISSFDEQTPDLLKKAILDIQKKGKHTLKGYIIDLRKNSGGVFDSAVQCCQWFIDQGVIVRCKGRSGTPEEVIYAAPGLAIVHNHPVIVLIDEATASAAEIMAGALQDHHKAIVLGVHSYGKGSTQEVIPLDDHQGAIKLTISRWYTPITKRPIQGHGIIPDILVEQIESLKPLRQNVIRECNVSGTLPAEQSVSNQGKADPLTPTGLTKIEKNHPSDQKEDQSLSDPCPVDSVPYDHQMTRACELIKALSLVQKNRLLTNPSKMIVKDIKA